MILLLQQEAECALRRLLDALPEKGGRVIPDPLRRCHDAESRILPDREPPVQHAVHGGYTDTSCRGEIMDGGTLDHGGSHLDHDAE